MVNSFPGHHRSLSTVRHDTARWLTGHAFDHELTDRVVLVVSELCANAVEAGPGLPVNVGLTRHGPLGVRITVSNTTLGPVPPPRGWWGPVDTLAPRGRGLAIVDALTDRVEINCDVPGRVTVVAELSPGSASPAA